MSHVYAIFGVRPPGKASAQSSGDRIEKGGKRSRRVSSRLSLSSSARVGKIKSSKDLDQQKSLKDASSPAADAPLNACAKPKPDSAEKENNPKVLQNNSNDQKPLEVNCPVCGMDYSSFTWLDKEVHIDACFERAEGKDAEVRCAATLDCEENDIRGEKYQCPICGKLFKDRHKIEARIDHLKACAAAHEVVARDFACKEDSGDEAFDSLLDALTPPDNFSNVFPDARDLNQEASGASSSAGERERENAGRSSQINASMLDYFSKVPKCVNSTLMRGAKQQHKQSQEKQQAMKRRAAAAKQKRGKVQKTRRWCPYYKKVPGTSFIVDGFHYPSSSTKYYFLSHFHSDHYGGLDSSFDAGAVVCNAVTSRLIQTQLGVKKENILVLKEKVLTRIGSHSVVALPANHCPGACVFLFFTSPLKQVHFHTGDFRYCDAVRDDVRSFLCGRRIDTLLLDTTYADPKYNFPPQEACIDAACERLLEIAYSTKVLVVFGTYSIGKERLFMEAVRRFERRHDSSGTNDAAGKTKIAVTSSKLRILRQLDWSNGDLGRFTTQKHLTRFWVVPMSHLRFDRLESHLRSYRRYTSVVAVRPTGWSFSRKPKSSSSAGNTSGAGATISIRKNRLGSVQILSVPYSEHSSFKELKRCVADFTPRRIVPTVNNKSAESTRAMVKLLCASEDE